MSSAPQLLPTFSAGVPLVVDLDGTLIRTDLLVESAFAHIGARPSRCFGLLSAVTRGKAALKAEIASATDLDVAHLPYDQNVIALIDEARSAGRPVYLASASHERYVAKIADHLGTFDGWFASNRERNLAAHSKAECLVEAFGSGAFDYVGNDRADLPVWAVARRRIAVRASAGVRERLRALDPEATLLAQTPGRLRAWLKLLRVHQWAKNVLVFLPLLTGHWFSRVALVEAAGAFLAFSLAASAIYIVNDFADVAADRQHPTKRHRPLAAGTVPVFGALLTAAVLLVCGMGLAFRIAPLFGAVLCVYVALTTAYTFVLKHKVMVDVVTLAALYTLRVVGGAAAIGVMPSEWILGFSMFIFMALALIKRYVELAVRIDSGLPDPKDRNYRKSDLAVIPAVAAGAGFNAVTVFALYISSNTAHELYRHPLLLWLMCPILMYWIAYAIIRAHRRGIHDDPVVFALKDRNSLLALGLMGLIVLLAA